MQCKHMAYLQNGGKRRHAAADPNWEGVALEKENDSSVDKGWLSEAGAERERMKMVKRGSEKCLAKTDLSGKIASWINRYSLMRMKRLECVICTVRLGTRLSPVEKHRPAFASAVWFVGDGMNCLPGLPPAVRPEQNGIGILQCRQRKSKNGVDYLSFTSFLLEP